MWSNWSRCTKIRKKNTICSLAGQIDLNHDYILQLYNLLNKEIIDKFLIKVYPENYRNSHKMFLYKFGKKKVIFNYSLWRFFKKCKFIITSYPDTSFGESIYSKIPSIVIFPKEFYDFSLKGSELTESLKSAGILYSDPKKAADHINKFWKDPDLWWESKDTIKVRKNLKNALGISNNFLNEWKKFLSYQIKIS